MSEVWVLHGRVRVLALPSRQVVAELDAGECWQAEPAAEPAAADAAAAERQLPADRSGTGTALWPEALVARARSLLASGQVDDAWSAASAALARQLSPALEAEARSLLAECALVKGHNAEAARRYGEVARRFPDSPAGESALFAAARTELDAGHRAAARALLRKYPHRYPTGRFRAEARRSALDRKTRGQSP